ncbi:MAG: 4-hydroxy-tetrahydrodipicolinate reductase [Clostridiales bacterium]|nr:4-hydroxy-tetrahydrodipicolinate reductase [Clostridiales bacterium]
MKKAFIFGLNGKMGKMLIETAKDYGYEVTGGFDIAPHPVIPTFDDVTKVNVPYDVIIDFSRPQTLTPLITLVEIKKCPVVLATTGYNASEEMSIRLLAKRVPLFKSGNMSLGIAATKAAARAAQAVLGDAFDIEIVEKHHNQKVDSPSGTALLLADALGSSDNHVINRDGKRNKGEIGITSVRGGGVVGEHEIGFYGEDEIVTISHSARSRKLFAGGAYKAADFLLSASPALYTMDNLVESLLK